MKQAAAENFVETNLTSQKAFTIKASAKAFKILSSGIYQNKIAAIIRELSCNAYDAQVAAGTQDKPFDVHMPSNFEPWFSVRDYGTGMDDAKIKKLYTTYFDSTKDQSNDFVGALGIGSKSPFSYTDNYTVIAWDGTNKRVYSCFISEDGTPAILKMATEKCNDPVGIEVRLAVKEADARHFQAEADNIYFWFSTLPNGVGNTKRYLDGEQIFPDVWKIKQQNGPNSGHTGYGVSTYRFALPGIRMGQVYYPVKISEDINNIKRTVMHRKYSITATVRDFFNYGLFGDRNLVFNVPIGAVDMTASREDLEYTEKTNTAIADLFMKHMDNQVKSLIDGVLDAESFDDANLVFNSSSSMFTQLKPEIKWNELQIHNNRHVRKLSRNEYVKAYDMFMKNGKTVRESLSSAGTKKLFFVLKDKPTQFVHEKVVKYMDANVPTFTNKLFKKYQKNDMVWSTYGNHGVAPKPDDFGFNGFKVIYLDLIDKRLFAPIEKALKKAKIGYTYASKLPALPQTVQDQIANKWELDCYTLGNNIHDSTAKNRRTVDPAKGSYYVVNTKYTVDTITQITLPVYRMAVKLGIITPPDQSVLYSVPKRIFEDVQANPVWIDLDGVLEDLKKKIIGIAETTFKKDLEDFETFEVFVKHNFKGELINFIAKQVPEFKTIHNKFKANSNHYYLISNLRTLLYEYLHMPHAKGNTAFYKSVVLYVNDNELLMLLGNSYLNGNRNVEDIIKPHLKGKLKWV